MIAWFNCSKREKPYYTLCQLLFNKVKIFVSYSRRDASDFAEKISETLEDEHDVFTDIRDDI